MIPDRDDIYAADPVRWARECLDFAPDDKQALVLRLGTARGLLNCTRQWGKSTVTAVKAVHRAWFVPASLVLVVSPSQRQSSEFIRKASAFLRSVGIRPRGDGDNEISLLLPNRSRLVGLPGRETTIRGYSAVNLLLIDEAARVPDDMYKAVRPMLAVGGGDLWLMSTPNGQRGFFHEEWERGGARWVRIAVPATECPRIPPAFLEEERTTMGERHFAQEYLCQFGEAEGALFDEETILRAIRPDIKPLFPNGQYR